MSRQELKDKITAKGVSIAKLARLADIHQDSIYNYLRGKSSLTVDNYEKLIKLLANLK